MNGYATDIPMITQSVIHKTEFKITKEEGRLCSSTFKALSVRTSALKDNWQEVSITMANPILLKLKIQDVYGLHGTERKHLLL